MTSIQRSSFNHMQYQKHLFGAYKVKNMSIKSRNYGSSKLIKTLMFNQTTSQNFMDKNACSDAIEGALEKRQLKKYCLNKFKMFKEHEKQVVKRKNGSLKILKREDLKQSDISKTSEIKSIQALPLKSNERTSTSLGRQFHSQQTITAKKRYQLIRLTKNGKLKLQTRDESQKNSKADVSFQQTLKMQKKMQEEQKVISNEAIRSENVLGQGLRKSSSNKIKVLVKNPFERHMKQQQALQQQLNQLNAESLAQLKQSQIIQSLDQSLPSIEHQQQLSELLSMM